MKTYLAALLGASMLTAPAMAADVYGSSTLKDNGASASASASSRNPFIGFNVGVQAGGQFTNINILDTFDGIGADGLTIGGHAGYNIGAGPVVFGIYGEGGFSNVNTAFAGLDVLNQDWYVQGGLLAGYLVNRTTLVSVHGGYEISQWSTDFSTETADVGSWIIGGALDTMVAEHVSIGLKLDYITPQSVEISGADVTKFIEDSEGFRGQLRVTYRH